MMRLNRVPPFGIATITSIKSVGYRYSLAQSAMTWEMVFRPFLTWTIPPEGFETAARHLSFQP
jgi:hypothetical protein